MIEIRGLEFRYQPSHPPVFRDFDLDVHSGEVTAILGASGCGKSTLLRLMAGLLRPGAGSVRVGARPPAQMTIPLVFQDPRLLPWMTVRQNLEFALRAANRPREEWSARIEPLLRRVRLEQLATRLPEELSIGMAQRISLVRALVLQPPVLLLDEPFAPVDPLQREDLQDALQELLAATQQTTTVIVTHDIGEALVLGDRVIVLAGRPGTIRAELVVARERPRDAAFRLSPEFLELQRQVRVALASDAQL